MPRAGSISPSEVADLIRIARSHRLSEVSIQKGAVRVQISLAESLFETAAAPPETPAPETKSEAEPAYVRSPVTGLYYVAPSPNDPPFVRPGDAIREGDPIGLIEAMKVYSEVLADRSGRVQTILVQNGKLVHAGDPLIELVPMDGRE